MTVCQANCQRAKMFVEYNSTRQKKERTVSAESATRDRTGDGTNGKRRRTSNARRDGNRTDKREQRANSARRSGKTARAGQKRRADGARRNGETVRTRRKRRVAKVRRDGKPGWLGRETVNHKRGGGKINASRPRQRTQQNKLAVTPE